MRLKDENKEELIFAASLALIEKNGIDGLMMARIAKEAGIATGTLYIYFKSKEDLVNALYDHLRIKSNERFGKGVNFNRPFIECLKKVWMNYLSHRVDYYQESIFLEQYYRSSYISEIQKKLAESMKKPVHDLIRRGKAEMLVKADVDEEMLFLMMLGFIRELADEHVKKIYLLTPEKIEQAFNLSWNSIRI